MKVKIGDEIQSLNEVEVVIRKKVIGRIYKIEKILGTEYAYFVSDDGLFKMFDIKQIEEYKG